ncbi:hypothetical protein [Enterococcus sp. DIV0756]|uniref:hypothetical protein n=1 Tax=Enterococcus sp. DIV0756 TaxID=2774636 RepID=UPI003F244D83
MNQSFEFPKNEMFYSTAFQAKYQESLSYYLYIPHKFEQTLDNYRLIVLIHGTERGAEGYRNRFKKFAELTNSIILAPLFPANPIGQKELANYNILKDETYSRRYDRWLLDIVKELRENFPIEDQFYLHGFSSGGQFVHRFFYLYPELLSAVSIGAPGTITLFDSEASWPAGVRDIEEAFDRKISFSDLKKVAVQIIAGENDTEPLELESGLARTRIENCRLLRDALKRKDIPVDFELVSDAGHNGFLILDEVQEFFLEKMEMEEKA